MGGLVCDRVFASPAFCCSGVCCMAESELLFATARCLFAWLPEPRDVVVHETDCK
jgi:hypothetical protein